MNKVAKEAAASAAAGGSRQRVDDETMQVVIDKDLLLRQRKLSELKEKYSLGGQENKGTDHASEAKPR